MAMLHLLVLVQVPAPSAPAEDARPVLKAGVPHLDVRDGELLYTREWEPDPQLPTDLYSVRRAAGTKRITLISDRGELAFELPPGTTREFWLELEDRRMPLQLSTRARPARSEAPPAGDAPIRIPLRLAQRKLHLTGRLNGSEELDLIFDTGASVCVLYPSGLEKGARFRPDLEVMNNGESRRGLALGGEVEVGDLRWSDEPVLFVEKQADRADGILGYTVFEDKVLEFDFERMELLVHEELPQIPAGYEPVPMRYSGSLTAVEIELAAGEWSTRGEFWLDTGADAPLLVQADALARELHPQLERIGSGEAGGVGPRTTRHALLDVPQLELAGTRLSGVPILAALPGEGTSPRDGTGLAAGVVGMPLLERFDLLVDYPGGRLWMRPNGKIDQPFEVRARKNGLPLPAALALGCGLLGLGLRKFYRRRRTAPEAR